MTNQAEPDTLEHTLGSFTRLDWPGPERNKAIEEFLMSPTSATTRPARSRLGLWIGAGVLLTGGMVYGGVRALDLYRVHLNVNGVDHYRQVQPGPDGTALLSVPTPGGGTARILVGPENMGSDGVIHAGITVEPATEKPAAPTDAPSHQATQQSQPRK